jgi:hypothetical protein
MAIVPDDKNWMGARTALSRLRFSRPRRSTSQLGDLIRANAGEWTRLFHEHACLRPTGDQWSALSTAVMCATYGVFDEAAPDARTD